MMTPEGQCKGLYWRRVARFSGATAISIRKESGIPPMIVRHGYPAAFTMNIPASNHIDRLSSLLVQCLQMTDADAMDVILPTMKKYIQDEHCSLVFEDQTIESFQDQPSAIIIPLRIAGIQLGRICYTSSLLPRENPLLHDAVCQLLLFLYARHLEKEKREFTEKPHIKEFFVALFLKELVDANGKCEYLPPLCDLKKSHIVLLIKTEHQGDIHQVVTQLKTCSIYFERKPYLLVLIDDSMTESDLVTLCSSLTNSFSGIGIPTDDDVSYRESALHAVAACLYAEKQYPYTHKLFASSLEVANYAYILRRDHIHTIPQYQRVIHAMVDEDPELAEVLQAYIENGANATQAATQLAQKIKIAKVTFDRKIKRIREICAQYHIDINNHGLLQLALDKYRASDIESAEDVLLAILQ